MMRKSVLVVALLATQISAFAAPDNSVFFDFKKPEVVAQWKPIYDIAKLSHTPQGMLIVPNGGDPYIWGPMRKYPAGWSVRATIRINTPMGGSTELFWFTPTKGTDAANMVQINTPPGKGIEASTWIPSLPTTTGIRIDPPCNKPVTIEWLRLTPMAPLPKLTLKPSNWAKWKVSSSLTSGALKMELGKPGLGNYKFSYRGNTVAQGWNRPAISWVDKSGANRLLNIGSKATMSSSASAIKLSSKTTDPEGATWTYVQTFAVVQDRSELLKLSTTISVNRDRKVRMLPAMVFFSPKRQRALFPGLEYLDPKDTSSSKRDIESSGYQRLTPDPIRATMPLMVMQADNKYVAMAYQPGPVTQPLFDSPDRQFGSKSHVMGLLVSDFMKTERNPGQLLSRMPDEIKANKPITVTAWMMASDSPDVLTAVQRWVQIFGLPKIPNSGFDVKSYSRLTAHGWLDTDIRSGLKYKSATWPGMVWNAAPVADGPMMQLWLADQVQDTYLADRLRTNAQEAIKLVGASDYWFASVGHIRTYAETLVFGNIPQNQARVHQVGLDALNSFEPDGSLIYKKPEGKDDLARTHWERQANGFASRPIQYLYTQAMYTGDRKMLAEAVRLTNALDRYDYSAPRGAQTWEMPLHCPDIMGSAQLVECYLKAYQVTGEKQYLQRAIRWAWSGVPFLYLIPPTDKPIGLYTSVGVWGATQWISPDWMGRPVQWCGMMYAEAVRKLAQVDPKGPWDQIWRGVTTSAIQEGINPQYDPNLQGLFPDSVDLRMQTPFPVAINPATVQSQAAPLYTGIPIGDNSYIRERGWSMFAPGWIGKPLTTSNCVTLPVELWHEGTVLVTGVKSALSVTVDGKPIEGTYQQPNSYKGDTGILLIPVGRGRHTITIM
ncbi:MAG: hypothetical protein ACYC1M_05245 [Armatimonadota bacterium]